MGASPNATLVRRKLLEPDLGRFWIRPDEPLEPQEGGPAFRPGQYVTLGVQDGEGATTLRPMTITSAPEEDGPLEFLLNRVRQPASPAPLSHALFALLPGARLFVRPAATGRFTLEATQRSTPRTKLLIAEGTGVAPFASMVRSRRARSAPMSDLVLWHAAERPEGLAFSNEFAASSPGGLTYQTWTSHELCAGLDRALDSFEQNQGVPVHPRHLAVFVCGLGGVIRVVLETLLSRGFAPPQLRLRKLLGVDDEPSVFIEQFDRERLFDLKDDETVARLKARFRSLAGKEAHDRRPNGQHR